jgi:hypothetical protein
LGLARERDHRDFAVGLAAANRHECVLPRAGDDRATFANQIGSFTLAAEEAGKRLERLAAEAFVLDKGRATLYQVYVPSQVMTATCSSSISMLTAPEGKRSFVGPSGLRRT